MTFDLPEPFGPTTDEKDWNQSAYLISYLVKGSNYLAASITFEICQY